MGGTVGDGREIAKVDCTLVLRVGEYNDGDERTPKGRVTAFQPRELRVDERVGVLTEGVIGTRRYMRNLAKRETWAKGFAKS